LEPLDIYKIPSFAVKAVIFHKYGAIIEFQFNPLSVDKNTPLLDPA